MPSRANLRSSTSCEREERGGRAAAGADHDVPAGAQDARDLAVEGGHVDLRHEVERIVVPGQCRRVGHPERDPALGIEADLVGGELDHPLRQIHAANAGTRELARQEQGRDAGSGPDVERALRSGGDLGGRRGEGEEVVDRAAALVPLVGDVVEELAHEGSQRRPRPRRTVEGRAHRVPDDPDPLGRRCGRVRRRVR